MPVPRQSFSVCEKIDLLKNFLKSNQTQGAFCKDNGLARGTFHGILKQKDNLLNYGGDILRKRKTEGKHAIIKDPVSLWVKQINHGRIYR